MSTSNQAGSLAADSEIEQVALLTQAAAQLEVLRLRRLLTEVSAERDFYKSRMGHIYAFIIISWVRPRDTDSQEVWDAWMLAQRQRGEAAHRCTVRQASETLEDMADEWYQISGEQRCRIVDEAVAFLHAALHAALDTQFGRAQMTSHLTHHGDEVVTDFHSVISRFPGTFDERIDLTYEAGPFISEDS